MRETDDLWRLWPRSCSRNWLTSEQGAVSRISAPPVFQWKKKVQRFVRGEITKCLYDWNGTMWSSLCICRNVLSSETSKLITRAISTSFPIAYWLEFSRSKISSVWRRNERVNWHSHIRFPSLSVIKFFQKKTFSHQMRRIEPTWQRLHWLSGRVQLQNFKF